MVQFALINRHFRCDVFSWATVDESSLLGLSLFHESDDTDEDFCELIIAGTWLLIVLVILFLDFKI